MPRKKNAPAPPRSREQKITDALRSFNSAYDNPSPGFIVDPRHFRMKVGDKCQVGHLVDCVVADVLHDGKAVLVEYNTQKDSEREFMVRWWYDAVPYNHNDEAPEQFRKYRPGSVTTSTIDSLVHMYGRNGLVVNPKYQRGYVWSQEDQELLLDSVFNRLGIGSFVLVRNHGFLHKNKISSYRDYLTLDGAAISVASVDNYTIEVIDGQQRITTLIKFITDQIRYKGMTYSMLNWKDRMEFLNTSFSMRLIEEEDVKPVELLELFLQVNRGVPQDQSHIAKVQALYEAEVLKSKVG